MIAEFFAEYPRFSVLLLMLLTNIIASVILVRASLVRPHITALVERARLSVFLVVVMASGIVLFSDRRVESFSLGGAGAWLSFATTVLVGIPGVWWLWIYVKGRFE